MKTSWLIVFSLSLVLLSSCGNYSEEAIECDVYEDFLSEKAYQYSLYVAKCYMFGIGRDFDLKKARRILSEGADNGDIDSAKATITFDYLNDYDSLRKNIYFTQDEFITDDVTSQIAMEVASRDCDFTRIEKIIIKSGNEKLIELNNFLCEKYPDKSQSGCAPTERGTIEKIEYVAPNKIAEKIYSNLSSCYLNK